MVKNKAQELFCFMVFILASFFFFVFHFSFNLVFFMFYVCLGQFYIFLYVSSMLGCQFYVFCLALLLLCFSIWFASGLGFLNNPVHARHEHAYTGQILCTWDLACIHRPPSAYSGICLETLIQVSTLFCLFIRHILFICI